ncbi:Hypothetical predicted protein, partial [Marmota monax]
MAICPCRIARCSSKTTGISTCTRLLAAHPCSNLGHGFHSGHPTVVQEQELQLPLPCGPPSINVELSLLPPSWVTATTAIVPYMWEP